MVKSRKIFIGAVAICVLLAATCVGLCTHTNPAEPSLQEQAQQGDATAQKKLGDLYFEGKGVQQSYSEAAAWYRKAAEQGDASAQTMLGVLYHLSLGVQQSYSEAATWYRKAAERGNANAQTLLGNLYYNGHGVQQSYSEAAAWFRKAAEQGDACAQGWLGDLYYHGRGVQQSYSEAATWYRKAAEQGDANAQGWLGVLYYNGQGVQQSYSDAIFWCKKAVANGCEEAKRGLSLCPCEKANLLFIAYKESISEFIKSYQNKDKYIHRLGRAQTSMQAWSGLNNHLMNCKECGSEYKASRIKQLSADKSELDARLAYLENAVARGLNGDNDSEDALIKIFEALEAMTKPLQNLPPIQIGR